MSDPHLTELADIADALDAAGIPDAPSVLARVRSVLAPGSVDLDAVEARRREAHAGPVRLLPTEEVATDPEVVQHGCTHIASLGGLGRDGRPVWALVAPLDGGRRFGPAGDGAFLASAYDDVPAMAAEIRALRSRPLSGSAARTLEAIAGRLAAGESASSVCADYHEEGGPLDPARLAPVVAVIAERDALRARVAELEEASRRHDTVLDEELARCDAYHKAADQLAYAIAPVEIIGEHSNANDPWENALEALETERRAVTLTPAARDVMAERANQRSKWGDENDDKHTDGTLATAAMALAGNLDPGGEGWIIDLVRKHAGNPRRRLVLAAAFALAEIERLDRAAGGSDA